MLSEIPRDLAEEVLSKLPVTSLRGVRSTCKKWNTLSKDRSFTRRHIGKEEAKKKQRKEFHVVMMLDFRVSLFSLNLLDPNPIERLGQLISLDDANQVDISNIFHCDGFLLCTMKDISRLVVWNPCSGQTIWIKPRNSFNTWDRYALGYDVMKKHKVLRFVDHYDCKRRPLLREFEIYSFESDSWKVLDVNPDWDIEFVHRGLSLHGNTYWFARDKVFPRGGDHSYFLLCYDFTTETFGPRLPLPFHPFFADTVALSSVGDNQIAVLFQRCSSPYTLKIWISSKIEPNAVSWKKSFLKVDMKPLMGISFSFTGGSFFVDEEKKVAVVLDKNIGGGCDPTRNIAYIIGKKGYFKKVDRGESRHLTCWPLGCSYVPSSVQINHKTA
ncbi:unnamed protein product [Arabidopsis lyrata]|uniref:F-box protein At2g18780-like n=1 Tax=Arabidopsis lyrata subsp. lyrata TaxID=81972 RepID=UPI000A29A529|nr:F-box protein At2g18780-like [Arabidopsis lyrata subsp. lyrata]CAH8262452.1 unnamed protein product [Arabidopsis lyrata]|eukprot:XP_020886503.1 F-box protein At2g18780-like [Arabidopsis lyrata subsp. lyrata]